MVTADARARIRARYALSGWASLVEARAWEYRTYCVEARAYVTEASAARLIDGDPVAGAYFLRRAAEARRRAARVYA